MKKSILEQITAIERFVLELLERKEIQRTLRSSDRLADLGFNSIDLVSIMFEVERVLNLEMPEAELRIENFESMASIQALVTRLSHG